MNDKMSSKRCKKNYNKNAILTMEINVRIRKRGELERRVDQRTKRQKTPPVKIRSDIQNHESNFQDS
jgi:hypothetical protein